MDQFVASALPLLTVANAAALLAFGVAAFLVRTVLRAQQVARRGEPVKSIVGNGLIDKVGEVQAVRYSRVAKVPEPAPYNELRTRYYECRYLVVRMLGIAVHCEGDEVLVPDEIVAAALNGIPVSPASMNHLFDRRLAVPPRLAVSAAPVQLRLPR